MINKAPSFPLPTSEQGLHFSLKPSCDSAGVLLLSIPSRAPDISPSRARSSNARWISAGKTTFSLRSLPLRTNKHGQSIVGGRERRGTEREEGEREREGEVIIYNHAITNSLLCAAKFVPARCYSVRRVPEVTRETRSVTEAGPTGGRTERTRKRGR